MLGVRGTERLRRIVARARVLTREERSLAWWAAFGLPVAALATRALGVRRIFGWLGPVTTRANTGEVALDPRRTVEIVAAVSRVSPLPSACLERSLVACLLLRRAGHDATLCIGASTKQGFNAHAWIEIDGATVGEPEHTERSFATLLRLTPQAKR